LGFNPASRQLMPALVPAAGFLAFRTCRRLRSLGAAAARSNYGSLLLCSW
jgi:hypothetical protein